jgi:Helix-turn-helix domain
VSERSRNARADRFRFVWDRAINKTDMPALRKHVAHTLAQHANADGTNAHPGVARLAPECSLSESAVKRHLAALRKAGWIVRTFHASTTGRKGMADCYDLAVPITTANQEPLAAPASTTNQVPLPAPNQVPLAAPHQGREHQAKESPTRSFITVRSVTGEAATMNDSSNEKDQRPARYVDDRRFVDAKPSTAEPDGPTVLADIIAELSPAQNRSPEHINPKPPTRRRSA